eukprot:snap_masked-scaffold_61-processed-gene-0.50-mRNA-1 protein AED:1.00 eAED:1.00 QI:0/-1/0/0/-1/1/1/0/604
MASFSGSFSFVQGVNAVNRPRPKNNGLKSALPCYSLHGEMPSPPAKNVQAKVFQMQVPSMHKFPEVELELVPENPVGVAISGGGSRALSLTCGYLRALRSELGAKFDYASAVSGGSWASSIYCYSNESDEDLLGLPTQPENLSLVFLQNNDPGKIATRVTTEDFRGLEETFVNFFHFVSARNLWTKLIGDSILKEFGLKNTLLAYNYAQVQDIRSRNPHLEDVNFTILGKDKPFLIINTTLLGPDRHTTGYGDSFQVTPLYSGVPFYKQNRQMDYHRVRKFSNFARTWLRAKDESTILTIGGGFIETHAVNAQGTVDTKEQYLPLNNESQYMDVKTFNPVDKYFTLQDAIGASSAAFASEVSNLGYFDRLCPEVLYTPFFSEKMLQFRKYQTPTRLNVGDGGLIDNLGLMALLQRKVNKIVCFVNTATPIDIHYKEHSKYVTYKFDQEFVQVDYKAACTDFLSLFGCIKFMSLQYNYMSTHVFKESDLEGVMEGLVKNIVSGKGGIVRKRLKVLPNRSWNIEGGEIVDIIFIYNQKCDNFEKRLPKETFQEIRKEESIFKRFPYYNTTFQNRASLSLTVPQVNLLSAQAEFVIKENLDLFKKFF